MAWQATTLVALALAAGLPLGIAAGRWAWALLADNLGPVPARVVPMSTILLGIPVAVFAANLVAAVPARAAAATRTAAVLRVE